MDIAKTFATPAIIHKIADLYKNVYKINKKLAKQDRFGIGRKIEETCIDCLTLSIESALSNKETKFINIQKLRIKIELLKQLIRILNEIGTINDKICLHLQGQLQEISKMATGWHSHSIKQTRSPEKDLLF